MVMTDRERESGSLRPVLPWLRDPNIGLLRDSLVTLSYSGGIALVISLASYPFTRHIHFGQLLLMNLVYSVMVGACIHLSLRTWRRTLDRSGKVGSIAPATRRVVQSVIVMFAVAVGFTCGTFILSGIDGEWRGGWKLLSLILAWGGLNVIVLLTTQRSQSRRLEVELALSKERQLRVEAQKSSMLAKIQALHAQIEPHFLFNSLANVAGLLERDPRTAGAALTELVSFLRGTLDSTRTEWTTVASEVALLRAYLNVMKVRLGKRLTFEVIASEDVTGVRLPSMLAQPLVENALKHAIEPRLTGGAVEVEFHFSGTDLCVNVRDDGAGFSPDWTPGVGLSNVNDRLAALYGPHSTLRFEEDERGWNTVWFSVPRSDAR
jgi:signal transduction histidine kinase